VLRSVADGNAGCIPVAWDPAAHVWDGVQLLRVRSSVPFAADPITEWQCFVPPAAARLNQLVHLLKHTVHAGLCRLISDESGTDGVHAAYA